MTFPRSRRSRFSTLLSATLLAGVAGMAVGVPAAAQPASAKAAPPSPPRSDALSAWRSGALDRALVAADAAAAAKPGDADAVLVEAEIEDARGRVAAAADDYRKALTMMPGAAARGRIELRLAMIAAMRRPGTLLDHARRQPPAVSDRVALVLALLGRPRDALVLRPGDHGDVADALRLAEWAIASGQPRVAEARAARAIALARDDETRRYALALLIEAHRDAGDLAGALSTLAAMPANPDVTAARVDMLLELGRTDAAIAIMEQSTDPALRRRLIGVLDLSGRDADGVREYRRLIAAHPDQPQWYGALAAQYLAHGDEAQAIAVYRDLFAANRGRDDVRIAAARQMIAMGMRTQAEALLGTGEGKPASAQAIRLFLFESFADQGDETRARQALEALRGGTTDPILLAEVADGYDRLGRPADALDILHGLEARGVPFGYDQQARVAEIAAAAGNRDEALARWRRLWASATLPARRSYIERQIAALARQTGQLDGIAREMEGRLDAGRLRPGEIDLLVALRITQDDQDAAVADVKRYAARSGAGEVATQEQLAALYARVRDYDGFGTALRRLTVIDPGHRDTHLRQLILNTLRSSGGSVPEPARRAELDRLIAELDRGGAAPSRQFKAAVYQMASLDDQALAELRADAAARPDDGDALLQLTGALKKRRRIAEAAALLQYAALNARTSAAFATAIDGLIDLLADAPADDASDVSPGAGLQWAERMVLERIVSAGEDARLLGLIADIGQARGDYGLQIRALDASLAAAGDQRASVLRELVTLNGGSGSGGDGAAGPAIGDPRLKIVYGRRLIALRKSYPPDFYGDLGRTLLERGDVPGAERAFAMMGDVDGLVNVDEVKGDAYSAQGYTTAALADYGRALLRDQDNLDLIVKTSILRERLGQYALARRWYWRGLRALILRQPASAADGQEDTRVEVRRHSATLVEGLLSTWPPEPAERRAITDELRHLFDDAVSQVDPAHPGAFASHPRLALIVETGQRIGDIRADDGMAGEWSAGLDRLFAQDADYLRAAARRRHLVGIAAGGVPPAADDADWPISGLRTQASDFDNVMLQLALAARAGDWGMVRTIADRALARENGWRGEIARTGRADGLPPVYLQVAQELVARLPADRVRAMLIEPLDASPFRDDILFDLFRGAPDDYAKLETIAGKPLLSNDRLFDLTVTRGNSASGLSARAARRTAAPDAWMARFSGDQLLTLYDRLVDRMIHGAGDSSLKTVLVGRLLAAPLGAAEQARLVASMQRDIGFVRDTARPSVGPVLPLLLQFDAAPANRTVVMQVARSAADRYPDARALPLLLGAWYANDRPGAYRAQLALSVEVDARYRNGQSVDALVGDRFDAERRVEAEAFLSAPDAAGSAAFYTRFVTQDNVPTDQLVRYYRTLLRVQPDNRVYRVGLLGTLAQLGQYDAFADTLRDYVAAHPEDQDAATTLAFAYLLVDKQAEAAAAARAANIDIADADWIIQVLNRSRAAASGGIVAMFPNIYQAYSEHAPGAPVVAAVRARGGTGATDAGAGDASVRRILDAAAHAPASVPGLLRGLWRDSAAPPDEGGEDDRRDTLTQALVAAGNGDPATAASVLGATATGELEHDLTIMEPEKRVAQQPLYDLVAHGLIAQGKGGDRLRAAASLPAGGDAHSLNVAAALANRQPTALDARGRDAIVEDARTMPVLSFAGRILLARVMAASGRQADAAGLLRAAVLQMLYPQAPLDSAEDAAAQIAAALDLWPDRQAARTLHAELSREIVATRRSGGQAPPLPPLRDAAGTDTPK